MIDPWGTVLKQAGEAEEILTAAADLSVLNEIRASIPALRDRRAELYELDE